MKKALNNLHEKRFTFLLITLCKKRQFFKKIILLKRFSFKKMIQFKPSH